MSPLRSFKYIKAGIIAGVFLFLLTVPNASAAPFTETFVNDYRVDEVHFWITSGTTTFDDWSDPYRLDRRSNPVYYSGWTTEFQTTTHLGGTRSGVINANRGYWDVTFSNDSAAFTMQWAEILNGVLQAGGSLIFDPSSNGWNSTTAFNSGLLSSVPVPTSMILLGSGLFGLLLFRRRNHQ